MNYKMLIESKWCAYISFIVKFFQLCYMLRKIHNKILEKLNLNISSLRVHALLNTFRYSGLQRSSFSVHTLSSHLLDCHCNWWFIKKAIFSCYLETSKVNMWVRHIPETCQNAKHKEERKFQ